MRLIPETNQPPPSCCAAVCLLLGLAVGACAGYQRTTDFLPGKIPNDLDTCFVQKDLGDAGSIVFGDAPWSVDTVVCVDTASLWQAWRKGNAVAARVSVQRTSSYKHGREYVNKFGGVCDADQDQDANAWEPAVDYGKSLVTWAVPWFVSSILDEDPGEPKPIYAAAKISRDGDELLVEYRSLAPVGMDSNPVVAWPSLRIPSFQSARIRIDGRIEVTGPHFPSGPGCADNTHVSVAGPPWFWGLGKQNSKPKLIEPATPLAPGAEVPKYRLAPPTFGLGPAPGATEAEDKPGHGNAETPSEQ